MSFPGFYSLGGAWLFLLVIPLIIFYFLKLKRPRLEISSLALWRQVMNDQRVNSPFQKFKRNILLLLQLLLLCFLALGAMQPFLPSGAEQAQYLPILIDCSASMAALDQPGGKTRLDEAKARVLQLIDAMPPKQRLSLIAMSSTARRVTDFTDNKRVLREALDLLTVSQVPSHLEDALRMTQAMSRTVPVDAVAMFTDGNVPPEVEFELPFELNYQRLSPAGANLGVTALNARRTRSSNWEVFVRVAASGKVSSSADSARAQDGAEKPQAGPVAGASGAPLSAGVELYQDGKRLAEETVVLQPGQSQRIVFSVQSAVASELEVRLKPDGFDALDSDNTAYLDLPPGRPLLVFCPISLGAFRYALHGLEEIELYPDDEGNGSAASYDLVITDRGEDAALTALCTLSVGVVPADLQKLVSLKTGLAEIVDWQRSAPLLQHVLLTDVQISDTPLSAAQVRDRDYEELGYEILAYVRTGPLILKKEVGGKLDYYLLFHTDRSTLPYRVAFPILISNLIQTTLQRADLSEIRAQPTGVLPAKTFQPTPRPTARETGFRPPPRAARTGRRTTRPAMPRGS
jgi:hypothetical protein